MKKTYLILLALIMTSSLLGQDIKIAVAPTVNNIFYYKFVAGGPYGRARIGFNTAIDYLFVTEKKVEFGMGIAYQNSKVEIIRAYTGEGSIASSVQGANIFSVSLRSVYNLKKDFYIILAPTLDLQIKHKPTQTLENQSGIGVSFGLGNNLMLKENLSLSIEPRIWIHNVIPFNDFNLPYRLTTFGLNMGLVFGHKSD